MLVLTRHTQQRIVIDTEQGQIVVTLVDAGPGKAKVGIEAPREIPVHREEVYRKLHPPIPPVQMPVMPMVPVS